MTEPPQFRTVLRGADPEQVAEALKELQTSLVVSRRAAADRTIELSRLQEEHQGLQASLATAQQRITELEQSGGSTPSGSGGQPGAPRYGDLGARIGSMLSLAEEEATQIRAAAVKESAERRDHAVRALAAELAAEEARLEEAKARTAALGDELTGRRAKADEEHGRMREHAMQEAEHIRQQARSDAEVLHRQAEERRAEAVAHRDQVHAHLGRISALIGGVLDGRPTPAAATEPAAGDAPIARDAQAKDADPTVDDVTPAPGPESRRAPEPDADATVPDATVPDATHPDRTEREGGRDSRDGSDSRDSSDGSDGNGSRPTRTPPPVPVGQDAGRPVFGSSRSADATQVIEPVPAQRARPSRPAPARETRQHYADAGDSFVGEPWHEEDGTPSR